MTTRLGMPVPLLNTRGMRKTIIVASDHAGFELKEHIKAYVVGKGYAVEDVGSGRFDPLDDYPLYMKKAAAALLRSSGAVGFLFGGSGQGEAMVANRYPGIRAMVYVHVDLDLILAGREHNDANALSFGARFLRVPDAEAAADLFLSTPFSHDARHERRIRMIDAV